MSDRLRRRADRIVSLYGALEVALIALVRAAVVSGTLSTVRGRRRMLLDARRMVRRTRDAAHPLAVDLTGDAYLLGVQLAARATSDAKLSGIQRQELRAYADNLTGRLEDMEQTVGRRVDDVLRQEGIRAAAAQALHELPEPEATQRTVDMLNRRGITGFRDRAGREWRVETYARMVVRTVTSEAQNQAVVRQMQKVGFDLVEVSSHGCGHHASPAHLCRRLEGKTLSLTGETEGFEVLPELPPFHPNCTHFLLPSPLASEYARRREQRPGLVAA